MGGSLEGRVAVITAGSTGIGFGIAEAFIAEGASVVLGNRSEEKGTYALERLKAVPPLKFAHAALVARPTRFLLKSSQVAQPHWHCVGS